MSYDSLSRVLFTLNTFTPLVRVNLEDLYHGASPTCRAHIMVIGNSCALLARVQTIQNGRVGTGKIGSRNEVSMTNYVAQRT